MEAFGGISDVDTSLVTVFQMLLEKDHGINVLPPRRMLDIKNTAEALMVTLCAAHTLNIVVLKIIVVCAGL